MSLKPKEWNALVTLMRGTKSDRQMSDLLKVLLTHSECESVAKRVQLLGALISEEQSQRSIAANLGLSIAKVTTGSKALQKAAPSAKVLLEEFLK